MLRDDKILNFVTKYYYLLLIIFVIIASIIGFVNLTVGLIYSYVIAAMLTFFVHDYAQHGAKISFRNTIIQRLFFFLAYLYVPHVPPQKSKGYITSHVVHHKLWGTEQEPVTLAVKQNKFLFICNPFFAGDQKTNQTMFADINNDKYISKWGYNDWLVTNRFKILSIGSILNILLFGLTNYITFFVLPVTFLAVVYCALPDAYFHSGKEKTKDLPYMLPIWFNIAYHIRHHKNPNELYFGSKWAKYFNLQYWVYKIGFTCT